MENEEKMMTGEESLKIITDMINKTKVNIRKSSFHLLFWGWLIFICSLSEYLLFKFTDYATPWYVWFFVIPGVFVSMIYGFVTGRKAKCIPMPICFICGHGWDSWRSNSSVYHRIKDMECCTFILILAAMPTFISGVIIRFRPLIIGGITFWIFALVAHFCRLRLLRLQFLLQCLLVI